MTALEVLEQVRDGTLSVEEAEQFFQEKPYEDLGYARLDLHRQTRTGFPEVVYCEGKSDGHLVGIYRRLLQKNGAVMGTRATPHQADVLRESIPDAVYDPLSRILKVQAPGYRPVREAPVGRIAVCSGGTADLYAAEEAAQTAEFFGAGVDRIYDVGVCGIHRLLSQLGRIRRANAVIAVAGMEGALPGVVAGLIENPVIALPTSVGYGSNMNGLSALLSMLNSCANGVAVVNIDNGYGAGYMAALINRLAERMPTQDVQDEEQPDNRPAGGSVRDNNVPAGDSGRSS